MYGKAKNRNWLEYCKLIIEQICWQFIVRFTTKLQKIKAHNVKLTNIAPDV